MNIKQGKKLREDINKLIAVGDYQEANKQSHKLLREAMKNHWQDLIVYALLIQLAYAIENDELLLAERLVKQLEKQPPTGYGMFLQARLLLKQKKRHEAIKIGEEALAFTNRHRDTSPLEIFEKIYNLLGVLYSECGDYKGALNCDWQAMEYSATLALKALNYSNYLFNLHFKHNAPEDYFKAHKGYNGLFQGITWYNHQDKYLLEAITGKPAGKIRVGYISPDLRYHVVLRFCWAMFSNYNKDKFEVYCYHNNPHEDGYSEEIKAMTDHWRNISGLSAQQAAEIIYRDKIDILVDLAGHTRNNPLPVLAYKPAPVQVSGIGYFATTGLQAVDYFISDQYLISEPEYFVEDIISLEHSHFCYSALGEIPATKAAPCVDKGYITFGSFNAIRKVTDEVLELWAKILQAVPDSHLLLKGALFDDEYGSELFCGRLAKFGIDIQSVEWQERIDLRGFSQNYLEEYLEIDIALDTFPYPGGGTTCDALYMGIPVITLSGNSHGERFGRSLLENIGLAEFVVYDKQAYLDLAVALAGNREIINNLHIGLRNMMEKSPLMDRKLYMQDLESAYKEIWKQYVSTLAPASCPPAKEALNNSFNCYKEKDFERAEAWCRLAIEQDHSKEYTLEAKSLLSDILQERLDYVSSWQESKAVLDLLAQEKDPGSQDFQRRLWVNYAARSHKLGYIEEAVTAYTQGAALASYKYEKFKLKGSALLAKLCQTEDCTEVQQSLEEINKIFAISPTENDQLSQLSIDDTTNNFILPLLGEVSRSDGGGKIHLAYISPDFRQHVMFAFYYTMLHSYNHDKFKITCISLTDKPDGFTEHLKGLVDNWLDISAMSWLERIKRLKKEKIDILVDLAGHSANSGLPLFCDRVAKVQISGLGWMEGTGLGCTDYLITDQYIDPDDRNIVEKPLYLTSQFCYTGRNDVAIPQGAPCKAKGYVTFGVFNHLFKWTDEMLGAWQTIMEQVPNSVLLLKCQALVSPSVCAMVRVRLQKLGFDLSRIILEPATNTYMNRYLDVDIALDTYPYPGGGTTCDALYMGVPVVSRYGQRRGTRFGLSILSNTGLGELAVNNLKDYIERAVGVAKDVELLDVLHKNLRKMMAASPIMDGKKYMSELEEAYITILAGKYNF